MNHKLAIAKPVIHSHMCTHTFRQRFSQSHVSHAMTYRVPCESGNDIHSPDVRQAMPFAVMM